MEVIFVHCVCEGSYVEGSLGDYGHDNRSIKYYESEAELKKYTENNKPYYHNGSYRTITDNIPVLKKDGKMYLIELKEQITTFEEFKKSARDKLTKEERKALNL